MKHCGSQVRTSLEEVNMVLLKKKRHQALLFNLDTCKTELWVEKDTSDGYAIEIEGIGYEFAMTLD